MNLDVHTALNLHAAKIDPSIRAGGQGLPLEADASRQDTINHFFDKPGALTARIAAADPHQVERRGT
jgi:hypothetical protein